MERFYSIAGIKFRVSGPDEWMYQKEGPLAPFVANDMDWQHWLEIEVVECLWAPEGELIYKDAEKQIYQNGDTQIRYKGSMKKSFDTAYMRICRNGNHSYIQVKKDSIPYGISPKLVMNAMEIEHMVVQNHGILLHASYIHSGNKAILFTAPSGTGKSTQADLWCRLRGAELLNGDRVAVYPQAEVVVAKGVPFSGSSRVGKNVTLPVAAIVYLSQASETTISRLTGVRAFRHVWEGCTVNTWNHSDMERCTEAVIDIVSSIPVFHLACTPDETAILALENVLENGGE